MYTFQLNDVLANYMFPKVKPYNLFKWVGMLRGIYFERVQPSKPDEAHSRFSLKHII